MSDFIGVLILVLIFWWLIKLARTGTRPNIMADKNKSLLERNQDIINKYVSKIYTSDRAYYLDNETSSCLTEIAKREGRSGLAPKYREWLSQWQTRTDIPLEWIQLKDYIKSNLKKRHEELLAEKKIKKEQEKKEEKERQGIEGKKFLEENKDLIEKFLEIAERKVSIIDEYGDENWDALSDEIDTCLLKIAKREGKSQRDIQGFFKEGYTWMLDEKYSWLKEKLDGLFREYHLAQKNKSTKVIDFDKLSGREFETYLARVLKENGYEDVRGTPVTGDQGADLIAKKDGRTIVIQAKRHEGSVGNRAVQEVVGALKFYGGDEGWVITNSTFTPSAKALAQKNNIKLIDGQTLQNIRKFLETQ